MASAIFASGFPHHFATMSAALDGRTSTTGDADDLLMPAACRTAEPRACPFRDENSARERKWMSLLRLAENGALALVKESVPADLKAEAKGLPQGARVLGFESHHLTRLSVSGHDLLLLNKNWTVRYAVSKNFLGRESASLVGHNLLLSLHPSERIKLAQRAAALPFANNRERPGEKRVGQVRARHQIYMGSRDGGMAEVAVISSIIAISAPERCLLISTKMERPLRCLLI